MSSTPSVSRNTSHVYMPQNVGPNAENDDDDAIETANNTSRARQPANDDDRSHATSSLHRSPPRMSRFPATAAIRDPLATMNLGSMPRVRLAAFGGGIATAAMREQLAGVQTMLPGLISESFQEPTDLGDIARAVNELVDSFLPMADRAMQNGFRGKIRLIQVMTTTLLPAVELFAQNQMAKLDSAYHATSRLNYALFTLNALAQAVYRLCMAAIMGLAVAFTLGRVQGFKDNCKTSAVLTLFALPNIIGGATGIFHPPAGDEVINQLYYRALDNCADTLEDFLS